MVFLGNLNVASTRTLRSALKNSDLQLALEKARAKPANARELLPRRITTWWAHAAHRLKRGSFGSIGDPGQ
jgi:hypothetical protein